MKSLTFDDQFSTAGSLSKFIGGDNSNGSTVFREDFGNHKASDTILERLHKIVGLRQKKFIAVPHDGWLGTATNFSLKLNFCSIDNILRLERSDDLWRIFVCSQKTQTMSMTI